MAVRNSILFLATRLAIEVCTFLLGLECLAMEELLFMKLVDFVIVKAKLAPISGDLTVTFPTVPLPLPVSAESDSIGTAFLTYIFNFFVSDYFAEGMFALTWAAMAFRLFSV